MYISPQERTFDPTGFNAPGLSMGLDDGTDEFPTSGVFGSPLTGSDQDDVARMLPPLPSSNNGLGSSSSAMLGMFEPLFGAIGSLFSQMSQMFSGSSSGQTGPTNLGNCTQTANEQPFQNVTASSTGDPHLAFAGTSANGSAVSSHWDNMRSHADLLDSDSFHGGYSVATQATAPNASGVTYNQDATVSMNNGNVSVELDANGNASLSRYGNVTAIEDGQSLNLGNGESVARNNDGSLVVDDRNRQGATIATTLRNNGSGVDVSVQADNVNLGGYMVGAAEQQRTTQPTATGADAP